MSYKEAQKKYAKIGIDTEKVIKDLAAVPISMHCWQGDDVGGFESVGGASNGIQTTGNYPGKATTPEQLMADIEFAMSLIPGKHRVNLHACYGIHEGKSASVHAGYTLSSWYNLSNVSLLLILLTLNSAKI